MNRVAQVFNDDGTGMRGNMQAVITAILTRSRSTRRPLPPSANPQYGKVRESLLRYTEWARAFIAQSRNGGYWLGSTEDPIYGLGEMTLRSPTVFNWFAPGYVPPGTSIAAAGLVGPELQMTNVTTVVGYPELHAGRDRRRRDERPGRVLVVRTPNWAWPRRRLHLVDRMNLLLMAGQMNSTLEGQIVSAVSAIDIPTGDQNAINAALAARVQTAVYLTLASPDFTAQQ